MKSPEKTGAALVAVALVGLISLQIYWAKRTYTEAEAVYNDKIVKILNTVKQDVNDAATCFALYSKTYIDSNQGIYLMKAGWQGKDELWVDKSSDSIPMFFNIPEEYKDSPFNRVFTDLKFSTPVTAEILLKFRYDMTRSSPEKAILSQKISADNFKDAIKNHEPLLVIYDTLMIDSLLTFQLESNNMPVDYSYALVKTENDSIEYSSNKAITKKILSDGIRLRLTPADLFSYPYDIVYYSSNKPQHILKNLAWVLSLSIGIIILLLVAYLYFIRIILRQKKVSEMKNDFINNMTHEFNTPIANISLAFETLTERGKIINDDNSRRILNIIQSETGRLKDNVTRILKISSFDRTGMDLSNDKIELTELVNDAISRLELKIKSKKAVINIINPEKEIFYTGDRLHLSNAIENLIDNALKYSNEECQIEIKLFEEAGEAIISITDNGVGMSKEESEKIFEKFYRVQHGNIQNDRGFGLGLNYVKHVIDAHGGKITVKSRPGAGSCFRISLNGKERKSKNSSY
jgi:two-component system phosphate regulon sensor histidine kinase PhoR